jgi:hypothetical protein
MVDGCRCSGGRVPKAPKSSGKVNLIAFLVVFALNLPPLISVCWDAIGTYNFVNHRGLFSQELVNKFNEFEILWGWFFGIPLAGLSILLTALFVLFRFRRISVWYWLAFALNIWMSISVMIGVLHTLKGLQ